MDSKVIVLAKKIAENCSNGGYKIENGQYIMKGFYMQSETESINILGKKYIYRSPEELIIDWTDYIEYELNETRNNPDAKAVFTEEDLALAKELSNE